jgi:hypothetical protein
MRLNCVYCGQAFVISTEQLGGQGRCPHCDRELRFPAAEQEQNQPEEPAAPDHFWENSVSGLTSLVVHMVLFLILALVRFSAGSGEGLGDEVLIGELPSVVLGVSQEEQLAAETPSATKSDTPETLEIEAPVEPLTTATSDPTQQLAVVSPSTGGGSTSSFDLGTVSIGGGAMGGGGWNGLLQNLRRHGLDIVITFDSTGSMGGEIRSVERQIHRIGSTLLKLVPKARIGLCTYRDEGDEYVAKGLPLTGDIAAIDRFLHSIDADAGGDEPEAVHRGLEWSVTNNAFRPQARKVILLFGDAPPHPQYLSTCLRIASDFSRQQKGVVSTVTCRSSLRLPEFVQIAQAGGGEAFLTSDERQIMTQLMVLVFGSAHRDKVIEAFKLMDR